MKGYMMLINNLCMIIDFDASKRCISLGKKHEYKDTIAPKTQNCDLKIILCKKTFSHIAVHCNVYLKLIHNRIDFKSMNTYTTVCSYEQYVIIASSFIKILKATLYSSCGSKLPIRKTNKVISLVRRFVKLHTFIVKLYTTIVRRICIQKLNSKAR